MLQVAMSLQYDALRILFPQYKQPKYAICRQILPVDIEVEYFCDNIIYHHPTSEYIFLQYTMHKI